MGINNKISFADGKPLVDSLWSFGDYRGISGILQINRKGEKHILIKEKPK
ncbi:hypothetical protein H8E88_25715 [candidate division KSB1 bacterium]|nr:hypothetical protein [candidate division KSB1 bacterium]